MPRIVIAYVPAIHQGYLNFFEQFPGDLYILGSKLLKEHPRLERDIRAVNPSVMADLVRSLGIMTTVQVLNDPTALPDSGAIVMPDEDISHNFTDKHLRTRKVQFIPTFLRWDRQISQTEMEVQADRVVSDSQFDKKMMREAERVAAKSPDWWRQVGAVATRGKELLLTAHNRPLVQDNHLVNTMGDPRSNYDAGENIEVSTALHAEAGLIARAARQGLSLDGASLYVTTFPCPVCAKSVAAAGVKKVYYRQGYSLLDAEDILKDSGVEIILVKK